MTEKIEVNGDGPARDLPGLVDAPNEKGEAGDVTWNFEKFLVDGDGAWSPGSARRSQPDDPRLVAAIEDRWPDGVPDGPGCAGVGFTG